MILGRRNVYCITAATLPVAFREGINARLRTTNGYLGSVEVDLGNPIQKRLLMTQLIPVAVIADGQVIMELSWEGTPETNFAGSDEFEPNGERRVAEGELDALMPPIVPRLPTRLAASYLLIGTTESAVTQFMIVCCWR